MTTILNPMMADHESKFERLARQVEYYEEGERHNARGNNDGFGNIFQNESNIFKRENPHIVLHGQNADEFLARLRNARSRYYVSLPESEVVKIATMGLEFYMRKKLLNVHIPVLAHLAEKVRQTELMKKKKEKYRSEQRSKSKLFSRKEKFVYVTMESLEEELNFETEVDLAKLKKGSPYVCSLLKKLPSNEKSNDSKPKSGKKYSFDISKSDHIFNIKDWDVSLCPRCNAIFDAKAAEIFGKERIKKELAHREEQA
ncbi:hypothetical protein Ahy_A03g014290 [Arachis hypogaea]|uniref:Uncharacterized protein n=1 Tax=Arachis hypogaea TaxID=3818 RepID=A0A445DXE0_ARAHY|nr:hypothetical protein Ahy_A03g014290 [Arachis hypogaea]